VQKKFKDLNWISSIQKNNQNFQVSQSCGGSLFSDIPGRCSDGDLCGSPKYSVN